MDSAKNSAMYRDCRRLIPIPLICGLILLLSKQGFAATITAASVALSDVQNAVNSAVAGETVQIPPGSATWTAGLTINKAITLQGSGIGRTIVKNGITASSNSPLLNVSTVANQNIRITGIEFQNGGAALQPNGVIVLNGADWNSSTIRFDNCKLYKLNGVSIQTYNTIGVIDHCTFVANYGVMIEVQNPSWGNVGSYGDNSWSSPSNFGTGQFLFIEDNTFTGRSLGDDAVDSLLGARYVFRHNTCVNSGFGGHGTESGGRYRGMRAIEGYNNTFSGTIQGWWVATIRSGVAIIHDNTLSGWPGNTSIPRWEMRSYRLFNAFSPWGGSDGTNVWDKNLAGGPFWTGTASKYSGDTVTVSGSPGWTTNQWAGYSIKRTTNLGNLSGPAHGEIGTSTSNTLTYTDAGGFPGGDLKFTNGDTIQIWKVTQALDQPGVSGGSFLSGATPSVPSGWNNQTMEPCYQWNNTYNNGKENINFSNADVTIVTSRHFYDNTRMPGYSPYVYPHPLVSGAVVAPTNLRGVP
jgi:hypothetical protein